MLPNAMLAMLKMKQLGLSKKDIAIRMGYKNFDKGMHKIHQFINEEYYQKTFSDNLLDCLEIDSLTIEVIETATNQVLELGERVGKLEREIESRKSFTPFIYKRNNYRPQGGISTLGLYKMSHKRLDKGILDLSIDEQLTKISKMIIQDFLDEDKRDISNNMITGYYYQKKL